MQRGRRPKSHQEKIQGVAPCLSQSRQDPDGAHAPVGADVNFVAAEGGCSPLWALLNGAAQDANKNNPKASFARMETPYFLECFRLLVDAGADLWYPFEQRSVVHVLCDETASTALEIFMTAAAAHDNREENDGVIQKLKSMEMGTSLNCGYSPLWALSCRIGVDLEGDAYLKCLELLLQHGADPNRPIVPEPGGMRLLDLYCVEGALEAASALFGTGPSSVTTDPRVCGRPPPFTKTRIWSNCS